MLSVIGLALCGGSLLLHAVVLSRLIPSAVAHTHRAVASHRLALLVVDLLQPCDALILFLLACVVLLHLAGKRTVVCHIVRALQRRLETLTE